MKKIEDYKDKKAAIHCSTKEEWDKIVDLLPSDKTVKGIHWQENVNNGKSDTINIKGYAWSPKKYYEDNGYTIYPASDFLEEQYVELITDSAWGVKKGAICKIIKENPNFNNQWILENIYIPNNQEHYTNYNWFFILKHQCKPSTKEAYEAQGKPKFEEGKWYSYNNMYAKCLCYENDTIISSCHIIGSNFFDIYQYAFQEGYKWVLLENLDEIQKYLPDGHIDKQIVKIQSVEEDFPKNWCFKGFTSGKIRIEETSTWKWFNKNFSVYYIFNSTYYYYSDGTYNSKIKIGFTEITHEQFLQNVLGEKSTVQEVKSEKIKMIPYPSYNHCKIEVIKDIYKTNLKKEDYVVGSMPDVIPIGYQSWVNDIYESKIGTETVVYLEGNRWSANIPGKYFKLVKDENKQFKTDNMENDIFVIGKKLSELPIPDKLIQCYCDSEGIEKFSAFYNLNDYENYSIKNVSKDYFEVNAFCYGWFKKSDVLQSQIKPKEEYKVGDYVYITNGISTTGVSCINKVVKILSIHKLPDDYVVTDYPNCGGIWFKEFRLATQEEIENLYIHKKENTIPQEGDYVIITKSSYNWGTEMSQFVGQCFQIISIEKNGRNAKFKNATSEMLYYTWNFDEKHFRKAESYEIPSGLQSQTSKSDSSMDALLSIAKMKYPKGTYYLSVGRFSKGQRCQINGVFKAIPEDRMITDDCGGSVYYNGSWAKIVDASYEKEEAKEHFTDKELLEEAERRYPIGTIINSLDGSSDQVIQHDKPYFVGDDKKMIRFNENQLVYENGRWATITGTRQGDYSLKKVSTEDYTSKSKKTITLVPLTLPKPVKVFDREEGFY